MLTRILVVRAAPERSRELESKLKTISASVFERQPELVRYEIGRRTDADGSTEFVLTSCWPSTAALEQMTGPRWREPHIPAQLKPLIESTRIFHYEVFASGPASP